MTLIELMVGVTIGLFLVAVMSSVYLGSKGTFNAQESVSRLQENGRFVVDTLAGNLRMAGFRACAGQGSGQGSVNNTLASASSTLYNFSRGIAASHNDGSGWLPALDATLTALSPSAAGDVLTVYRPFGGSWALTSEMSDGSSDISVSPTANIGGGDILVVGDCAGAAVFQASNSNAGSSGLIQHSPGGAYSPGVTTANLGRAYLQDATLYRLQAITYYLAPSVNQPGLSALWSYTSPGYGAPVQATELVTGVERLAVTFGVDSDGDFAADKFVTANAVSDWTQVVDARIQLLLDSPDSNSTTSPQPYVFGGVTTTPTDHRMRTVVSLVASLRNTTP